MYSQHGEDEIIAKLFDGHIGNLIDVGAYVAKDLSNSRLLIESDWDATLIEFSPMAVKNLVTEYAANSNVRVISTALTAAPQHVQPFRVTDDGLSSNDPAHYEKWKDFPCGYYGTLYVPTMTVRGLIDQFYGAKPIHFVSIDTEGTSVDLAIEFMRLDGLWKPCVMCVEHDDQSAEPETDIAVVHRNAVRAPRFRWLMENAERFGYRMEWMNNCNVILVQK